MKARALMAQSKKDAALAVAHPIKAVGDILGADHLTKGGRLNHNPDFFSQFTSGGFLRRLAWVNFASRRKPISGPIRLARVPSAKQKYVTRVIANEDAANLANRGIDRVQADLAFDGPHGRLEIILDAQLFDQL